MLVKKYSEAESKHQNYNTEFKILHKYKNFLI